MSSDQSAREAATSAREGTQSGAAGREYVPRQSPRYDAGTAETGPAGAVRGFTLVAAVLMMISGAWDILQGIAAIIHGSFVVVVRNYAYSLSAGDWGWFHLIMGAVMLAAGIALLTDKFWARMVGVAVVTISMIVNFLYIPYQPVWSVVLIGLNLTILWALLAPRRGWD